MNIFICKNCNKILHMGDNSFFCPHCNQRFEMIEGVFQSNWRENINYRNGTNWRKSQVGEIAVKEWNELEWNERDLYYSQRQSLEIEKLLKNKLSNGKIEFVLEIGGANQPRSFYFDAKYKYALDPMMSLHKSLYKKQYESFNGLIDGTSESINLASETFDAIILSNCLDHFHSPEKGLEEVFRVLKNDGICFIGNEIFPIVWKIERKYRDKIHDYRWTLSDMKRLIKKNGGNIVECIKNPLSCMLWQKEIYAATMFKKMNVYLGRRNYVWLLVEKSN